MSQMGKVESGAELLARLGSRPTPQSWEAAKWLGFDPSPGDIVEICGSEGVGKSELLLNLVASALLPTTRGQQCGNFHGHQPQAVWVDCDMKLSVLRLAMLLEHGVVQTASSETSRSEREEAGNCSCATDSHWKVCGEKREEDGQCCDSLAQQKVPCYSKQQEDERSGGSGLKGGGGEVCISDVAAAADKLCGGSLKTESSALKRKAEEMDGEDAGRSQCCLAQPLRHCRKGCESPHTVIEDSPTSHSVQNLPATAAASEKGSTPCGTECVNKELSAKDTERKVLECLERVHVARCTSSQQLICTLCSVESQIAANPNITLLVIDSISAFFWSDKCSDFNNAYLFKNVSHIASVLKKIAQTYGVLVVVAKQALMKPRVKNNSNSCATWSVNSNARSEENGHVEFLGSVWNGVVTKHLVCSKAVVCQRGVNRTHYTLAGRQGHRGFTISESGVRFDQK